MITRTLGACVAVLLAGQTSPAAAANATGWSAPRTLSSCAAALAPRVAFPSESPARPTGRGAVVWVDGPRCPTAAHGSGLVLSAVALGGEDRAATGAVQPLAGTGASGLEAVGASRGSVAVAAATAGTSPLLELLQGTAPPTHPIAQIPATRAPFSLARAYLGDSAIATVAPGPAIAVRVERYFRSAFTRPLRIPIGPAPVSALVATMDYRSDVLVAWQQNGAIYAHMLRASGRAEPTQRVGASAPGPQLRALVSDNDHGMIAWSSTEGSPIARTSVRIAFSGAGVRFAASRLITSFADPLGAGRLAGSVGLVRLSTENVMLAWTDSEAGTYVVRAAPAVVAGTRPAANLSAASSESVLIDLAAGPAGEAVALWRSWPPGSSAKTARGELWAARASIERQGRVGARAAEIVAPADASADASVAVDPASDRAVAAWRALGPRPRIEYAAGPGASAYRPQPPLSVAGQSVSGGHPYRIAILAAAAAAAVALVTLLAARRRRRVRSAGGAASRTRRR